MIKIIWLHVDETKTNRMQHEEILIVLRTVDLRTIILVAPVVQPSKWITGTRIFSIIWCVYYLKNSAFWNIMWNSLHEHLYEKNGALPDKFPISHHCLLAHISANCCAKIYSCHQSHEKLPTERMQFKNWLNTCLFIKEITA